MAKKAKATVPGKNFSVVLSVEGVAAFNKLWRRDRKRSRNLVIDWAVRRIVELTVEAPKTASEENQ